MNTLIDSLSWAKTNFTRIEIGNYFLLLITGYTLKSYLLTDDTHNHWG